MGSLVTDISKLPIKAPTAVAFKIASVSILPVSFSSPEARVGPEDMLSW